MLDCLALSMENGKTGDSILSVSYFTIHSASLYPQTQTSAVSVWSGRFREEHASYLLVLITKVASTYPGKIFSSASSFRGQLKVSRCNYPVVSECTCMIQKSRDIVLQGLADFEHKSDPLR